LNGKVSVRIDGLDVISNILEIEKPCYASIIDLGNIVEIFVTSHSFPHLTVDVKIFKSEFRKMMKRVGLETIPEGEDI